MKKKLIKKYAIQMGFTFESQRFCSNTFDRLQ